MHQNIGHNLRILRFMRNLTQKQVSEATGIKTNTLSRYKNDKTVKYRKSNLKKLADFYEVSIEEIIESE